MKAPKKTALRKATSKSTPTKRRKAICPYSRGESEPPRDAPHWSPYWTPHPKFFSGRPRNASLPPVVHPPTHIRNKPRVHPDEKPPKLDMWPQEWHRGDMPQSNALTQAEGPEIDLAPDEVASGVTASSYLHLRSERLLETSYWFGDEDSVGDAKEEYWQMVFDVRNSEDGFVRVGSEGFGNASIVEEQCREYCKARNLENY